MPPKSTTLRRRLVAQLLRSRDIRSAPVRRAFLVVPRELFVPEHAAKRGLEAVYRNDVIVTKTDAAGMAISSSSQPSIMAIMLEMLRLEPGHRVLEIGAGSGYNAALLSSIVGSRGAVTSVELEADLARSARAALRRNGSRVTVIEADGGNGWARGAPYDRIIATASAPTAPRAWLDQLGDGGILEFPLRLREGGLWAQTVVAFRKEDGVLRSIEARPGGFMAMRARAEAPAADSKATIVWLGERARGRTNVVAQAWGPGIARMTKEARRQIMAALLAEPRVRPLGARRQVHALRVFLMLATPVSSFATLLRPGVYGVGIATPDGTSAAFAVAGRGPMRVEGYGTREAERALAPHLRAWEGLGSPGDRDMRITITYGRGAARAWRTLRRDGSCVSVDWSS